MKVEQPLKFLTLGITRPGGHSFSAHGEEKRVLALYAEWLKRNSLK